MWLQTIDFIENKDVNICTDLDWCWITWYSFSNFDEAKKNKDLS